jgi:hypothetical protein
VFKKCLTGPTLLEMSGYPTNRELRIFSRKFFYTSSTIKYQWAGCETSSETVVAHWFL